MWKLLVVVKTGVGSIGRGVKTVESVIAKRIILYSFLTKDFLVFICLPMDFIPVCTDSTQLLCE